MVLKAVLDIPEGSQERYEAEWFLYSVLARQAAGKAEIARLRTDEKKYRDLKKAARKAGL